MNHEKNKNPPFPSTLSLLILPFTLIACTSIVGRKKLTRGAFIEIERSTTRRSEMTLSIFISYGLKMARFIVLCRTFGLYRSIHCIG